MSHHLYALLTFLVFLVLLSGFFAAAETAMMSVNRYRLRHMIRKNNRAAKRVGRLLERPDRLLGLILIGATFTNIVASSVMTVLAIEFYGNAAIVPATFLLAIVVLIFSEIMPKTLAALYPERLAFPSSGVLAILLKLFYPLIWCANLVSNGLLRLLNIHVHKGRSDDLTHEEVQTLMYESTGQLTGSYKRMVLGVLDLGAMTVDDVKVPRNDIVGIDLEEDWPTILHKLAVSEHTRLPAYKENINQVLGILHARKLLNLASLGKLDKASLLTHMEEAYFIPEGTSLNIQLVNFKEEKKRMGLIVDEYGDVQGLLALEDILEEIVGEFTTNLVPSYKSIKRQKDGTYLLNGAISIRELNRRLHLDLPVTVGGPKTLSGLVIEYLETIPESTVCLDLAGYLIEVVEIKEKMLKTIKIWPEKRII